MVTVAQAYQQNREKWFDAILSEAQALLREGKALDAHRAISRARRSLDGPHDVRCARVEAARDNHEGRTAPASPVAAKKSGKRTTTYVATVPLALAPATPVAPTRENCAGLTPRQWRLTVNITEAAKLLGVSKNHAYAQLNAGTFPCKTVQIGTRTVVPITDLARLLDCPEDLVWEQIGRGGKR